MGPDGVYAILNGGNSNGKISSAETFSAKTKNKNSQYINDSLNPRNGESKKTQRNNISQLVFMGAFPRDLPFICFHSNSRCSMSFADGIHLMSEHLIKKNAQGLQ